ncbi:hypothetical protein E2C01_004402 [Portunus trituberculatus]|uniref:Uncharacterized protein n=1 Tax=Portunus trituberculatus TaxID=210409 RepID=A0A5B7CRJ4_PORTR|nr:hypothetical protein [Portunus trituberculatus]
MPCRCESRASRHSSLGGPAWRGGSVEAPRLLQGVSVAAQWWLSLSLRRLSYVYVSIVQEELSLRRLRRI